MTDPLCKDSKFYNNVCQVILLSLYFNKHIKHTKLKDLRNTVDGTLRLQSKDCIFACQNAAGTSFNTSVTQYFGLRGSLVSGQSTETRCAQVTVDTAFQFSQLTCNVTSNSITNASTQTPAKLLTVGLGVQKRSNFRLEYSIGLN
jgi:hypothetical protein